MSDSILITKQLLNTRRLHEVANTTTYHANGVTLGTWNPHHMIKGPKGSIFVACNTAVQATYGSNSVYCYHVVVQQNTATGLFYTANVYPVYANSNHTLNAWQYCTGLALDNNDPPNLYYATGNTIYKIEPKGYSYHMGDTKITQLFSENHLRTTYHYNPQLPVMGKLLLSPVSTANIDVYREPNSYVPMKVDRNNRLFFVARSNIFCYDTMTNSLQSVYHPTQHTGNIAYTTLLSSNTELISINSIELDRDNGDIYFSMVTQNTFSILCKISPNSNGSYTVSDGGLRSSVIIAPNITTHNVFWTDGTTGTNQYRGYTGTKVKLRPSKN